MPTKSPMKSSSFLESAKPLGISNASIEKIADSIRQLFNFDPVNDSIFDLLEKKFSCEIRVVDSSKRDLQSLGTVEIESPEKWTIYVPSHSSPLDDKFTLAHELGHFVLHSQLGAKPIRAFRRFNSNEVITAQEVEADAFALALLIPREVVIKLKNEATELTNLPEAIAAKCGVDIHSAKNRLNWIDSAAQQKD